MSKDKISLNDILEEYSPDGHKVEDGTATTKDSNPTTTPVVVAEKSLEELELEQLNAISQGELSDSAINYSSYTNKPNKIIDPSTRSKVSEPKDFYPPKGVVKINSRPDFKKSVHEEDGNTNGRVRVSDDLNGSSNTEPKKIDSRNDKAKFESANRKKSTSRMDNDTSTKDYGDMSETFRKAKAKRTHEIDELNANLKVNVPTDEPTPTDTHTSDTTTLDEPKPKKSKSIRLPKFKKDSKQKTSKTKETNKSVDPNTKKKSIVQRILDYYTYVEEEEVEVTETSMQVPIDELADDFDTVETVETPTDVEHSEELSGKIEKLISQLEDSKQELSTLPVEVVKEIPQAIATEVAEDTPQAVVAEVAEDTPQTIATEVAEDTPQAVATEVAEDTPQAVTTEVVEDTPQAVATEVAEDTPQAVTTEVVEDTPQAVTTEVAEDTPQTIATEVTEDTPQTIATEVAEDTPQAVATEVAEDTPQTIATEVAEDTAPPKRETVKEFVTSLFGSEEEPKPKRKESFKERMAEFFTVEDTTPEPPVEPSEKSLAEEVPIAETTPIETPIEEPKLETIAEDTPKDVPTSPTKNPFKRLKDFFLAEEMAQSAEDSEEVTAPEVEELPITETLEPTEPIENAKPTAVAELTEVSETVEVAKPIQAIETPTQPIEVPKAVETVDTTPIQPTADTNEEVSQEVETPTANAPSVDPNEGYTMPFDENTPDEAIDIPILEDEDTKPHYKHFWQDPDFSPIDRFRTYWETTAERYKNRKRSGEVHIEIKSNPETAILFADLKNKVLAEEELQKSREEFKKQVQEGQYEGYEDEPSKSIDEEPTFENTSINDFNTYEDKDRVLAQIAETKTSVFVRTTIIAVLCIISTYIALANDLGLPIVNMLDTNISVSGYLMVQSACGFVAILTSIKSVISGVAKVFKRRADSDSFSAIGIVSAFVTSLVVFLLSSKVSDVQMLNIYMPVALLGMLSNLRGKSLIVKREECNFKYISKDKQKCGLFCMQDDYDAEQFTKGLVEDYPVTAYKRKTGFAKDFIKYTYSYDMADRFSKYAVPIVTLVSLVVALISALFYNTSFGMIFPIGFVSIFSMLISFCSCFSIPVYINSILYDVSKKYAKREGAILGYQAVEDFYDTNSMVISANDIFPKASINLKALKLFSNAKVDETLIYAISLAKKVDSILAPTLLEILDGNLELLCNVENCSYEDGLGICGWIDNKRVLMGNRELMESHNIENLPTKSKEAELVGSKRDCIYVSVSGNLSLMLIVELIPNKKITKDLNRIQDYGIAIAVTSSDFLISVNKLGYLFGIDPESVKIIPSSVFEQAKDYFSDREHCSTSIVTGNDIGTVASMLISTKKIHAKAVMGNVLNAVSCIVGIIIGISFITMGGFRELTSTMVLVYNLICCAITLLICNTKRF